MSRLRIVLVEDGTFAHGSLRDSLGALDVDVVAEGADWETLADQAEARSADAFVVVAGEDPRLLYDIACGGRPAIVVTEQLSDVAVAPAVEHGASAFVSYPIDAALFHAQARAAVARAADLTHARNDAEQARDQLETRKLVERAKGILMERLGLSEHDAFRKLQKASQDENRKMREIADSVIRAEKMFGEKTNGEVVPAEPRRRARSAS
ncbi:MAG: ANTAR domain-containing response regulator [Actinomycetota bacterium]